MHEYLILQDIETLQNVTSHKDTVQWQDCVWNSVQSQMKQSFNIFHESKVGTTSSNFANLFYFDQQLMQPGWPRTKCAAADANGLPLPRLCLVILGLQLYIDMPGFLDSGDQTQGHLWG